LVKADKGKGVRHGAICRGGRGVRQTDKLKELQNVKKWKRGRIAASIGERTWSGSEKDWFVIRGGRSSDH